MQSLFLSGVFFSLMCAGFLAPFAAALGFVWVDIVQPQNLAYSIINSQPLSFIAALVTLVLYFAKDKKAPPKFGGILLLIVAFGLWLTLTTFLSDMPKQSWAKWDWVSKVVIFAVIIPYIFRSRIQIEAFLLVFVFASCTILSSAGVKTLFGGGGYQTLAIMGTSNTGLSETSTLAVVCVMLIPLVMFLMRYTLLFPKNKLTFCLFAGIIFVAIAAVVGTGARTGVIAIAMMCAISFVQSKKKSWWFVGFVIAAVVMLNLDLSSTRWGERMSTIETYNADSSAMGRIAVWNWTLHYVGENPLGGGFNAYLHNHIAGIGPDGTPFYFPDGQIGGKAFHSIYFEMLGEQGIFGFIIYFSILALVLLKLHRLKKTWRKNEEMAWLVALANAMMTSIMVFLAGGAFVGIAYQPFIFYLISLTVAIDQYAARVEKAQPGAKRPLSP
jgi:putative inorganic carbon (HCO3(-)) transporter